MPFEPGLMAYAALAAFSLTQTKHGSHRSGTILPNSDTAKSLGIILLCLSALSACLLYGPALGSVIWVAQTSVAAVALVLLLSWKPLLAFYVAGIAGVMGALGPILQIGALRSAWRVLE